MGPFLEIVEVLGFDARIGENFGHILKHGGVGGVELITLVVQEMKDPLERVGVIGLSKSLSVSVCGLEVVGVDQWGQLS